MIRAEYLRFMQTLGNEASSVNVRKIANIVLENIDTLIPLTTRQGQRIQSIVPLAQANWSTINTKAPAPTENDIEKSFSFNKITKLITGPFRGFAKKEEFDLNSLLVLIYGPNGTGKSSFCEALEHALLGNVADAESKRFRNQDDYLKNAHTNSYVKPTILGTNNHGEEVPIQPNDALYRFCFVEKNRIDSFSRIAAHAPAKQTELISTLFGLESFNEFVRNFSPEIDDKYIDLLGVKANQLRLKQQSLAGSQLLLKENKSALQLLVAEEIEFSKNYNPGLKLRQVIADINGDADNLGKIKQIETELLQPVATKSGLSIVKLNELLQTITTSQAELTVKQQELVNASQQISFQQLYEAVVQLQLADPDHCPACKTPIEQVTINPYTNASDELNKLQHLSALQQRIQQLNNIFNQTIINISQIVNSACARFSQNPLHGFVVATPTQANIAWWNSLHEKMADGFTPWQHIDSQVKQLEQSDLSIDQLSQQRVVKQQELVRLRGLADQIIRLQTQRQTIVQAIKSAENDIATFAIKNEKLIAEVKLEKATLVENMTISSAYSTFVSKLNAYRKGLPQKLVSDLGELVVSLYNSFNRNDSPHELLASVQLPLSQNQRLKVSFTNEPTKYFDALHILSEGHIRCIGLAILLAKNINERCPLLIFDDPVNAIDDEHRESIRRTLFEDDFFKGSQIILACHGEEFFKDIQNLLTVKQAKESNTFSFLPKIEEQHIRVDFNCSPRNYIITARNHLELMEIRDALAKSRQALESLTKGKLWQYVHKHGDGNLSIKLRTAKAPIELRNLSDQLKSKISQGGFSDENKDSVLTPLNHLLLAGRNGESREWHYLNKGTHEEVDRAEFDRNTVHQIVSALEELDIAMET